MLLTYIGQKRREIYETFTFDKMKLAPLLYKCLEYGSPSKNTTILRYKVFTYRQQEV